MKYIHIPTRLGEMILAEENQALQGAWFVDQRHFNGVQAHWQKQETALLKTVKQRLQAYFTGQDYHFDFPIAPQGTVFQQSVWQQLQAIPCGHTCSYGDIARTLEKDKAVRAVGAAVGRNPLGVIIPCHRVIAANGALTGYAGGLERKQWLLEHENHRFKQNSLFNNRANA